MRSVAGLGVAEITVSLEAAPRVSIVMPVRNEALFIERSLRCVLGQDYPIERTEIIVVDGMSTDRTKHLADDLLRGFVEAGGQAQLIDNPEGIAPTAMNAGIAAARGDVVVRVDGHTLLPTDYVRRCVEVLQNTRSQCVGGVWVTHGSGEVGRAIAAAQSSRFGVGGVAFRVGRVEPGPVDTVPFGAYPREVFTSIGGFDPELVRNQDDELNMRLIQAGGTVWYDPIIHSDYFSRTSLRRLWRQYFEYGLFKVRVAQKRGGFTSVRHLVPAAFVAGAAGSLVAAAVTGKLRWGFLVVGPYIVAAASASVTTARRERLSAPLIAAAYAVLHVSYGTGFICGLWRWRRGFTRRPRPQVTGTDPPSPLSFQG